ncbi:hypothetical protein VSDG_04159 [Cytospora chrysosperma]|uniref:Vesicular-fusion protein SEC18 n=1 Tax=Cytospora chrysosperma TaxID=252740 RepID=A0A423W134_CYTCH|nr:hypothetical protein VSDG_04159 [Valsa sordida]
MSRAPPGGPSPYQQSHGAAASSLFGGRAKQPPMQPPTNRPYPQAPYGQPQPPAQRPTSSRKAPSSGRGQERTLGVVEMTVVPSPDRDDFIFRNYAAVNPQDWGIGEKQDVCLRIKPDQLPGQDFVLHALGHSNVVPGRIAFADAHRTWLGNTTQGDEVRAENFDPIELGPKAYLGSIDIAIGFASPKKMPPTVFDQEALAKHFAKLFQNQIFAPGQQVIFKFDNVALRCTVSTLELVDLSLEKPSQHEAPTDSNPRARGILTSQTEILFHRAPTPNASYRPINLKGSTKRNANAIVRPDFKFADMGIGGLDDEFSTIFRRAFASRIFPPALIEQLGLMHVKGILLYGPPGTGKTLIARQIGKMLQAREPKVINGPEVLNKYVGQSEENIRKLFADAEKEYKEKGDESELHVIIFDELDAVCKQRGSGAGGGTGVGDSVVNQLLSKLDGVDQLNNILLIGMTNRKDMIDDALLRPGRLEVQVEISLPDEHGRQQILNIHTNKMKESGRLAKDVNLDELAALTKNFSGAELNGLCKSAASFAFSRHTKAGTMAGVSSDASNLMITREDFIGALSEVTPAFGVSEGELIKSIIYGIIYFSPNIDRIINSCMIYIDGLRNAATKSPNVSLLFHGPSGSGKTSLAASIAKNSEFPFVKVISPELLVGYRSENAKSDQIHKIFSDAFKSPLSILIVDDIEGLIEWNPVGPRMSNTVLQTLRTLLRTIPPANHRLLVMGTTSRRSVLQQLDFTDTVFDKEIAVPNLNGLSELELVLREQKIFQDESSMVEAMNLVAEATQGSNEVGVGIKNILKVAESAKALEEDMKATWFAEEMQVMMSRGY